MTNKMQTQKRMDAFKQYLVQTKRCAICTTRDQAAVHGVQIHVGNHFKEQSEEARGTFCLSASCLEFIWRGLIGGSAFVNLNTSNTDES